MRHATQRALCTRALALTFAAAVPSAGAQAVKVIEYYNVALDHYFITSLQPDIDALDSGHFFGWSRTGLTFQAFADQASGGPGVNPVCRFLIPPPADSHFFSASPVECAAVLAKIPTDPNHLIGVWQQDRWSDGGAAGQATGVSFDGGRTWSRTQAPLSRCTGGNAANGGDYPRVSDPWATVAPDGAAYQIGITFGGG